MNPNRYEREHHSLQTSYLLSGKTDRKGRLADPLEAGANSEEYRKLAERELRRLGRPVPTSPAAGATWKSIYQDAAYDRMHDDREARICRRCHKEPVNPGELCVQCQYAEQGEAIFAETVEFMGVEIKIDHQGRAHILSMRYGPYWVIMPDLKKAKAHIKKSKGAR